MGVVTLHYDSLIWSFIGALVGSIVTGIVLPITINFTVDRLIKVLSSKASSNDALISYIYHNWAIPWKTWSEIQRRADTGQVLLQPAGTPQQHSLSQVAFSPAPLTGLGKIAWQEVNAGTSLGSHNPLYMESPLVLDAPSFGLQVSRRCRQVFINAANASRLVLLTGEQCFPPAELASMHQYIYTASSTWFEETEIIASASMIELKLGQATCPPGLMINGRRTPAGKKLHQTYHPRFLHIKNGKELAKLCSEIKGISRGAPVAVRLTAGNQLEADIEVCIEAGIEAIILEARESDSFLAPEITASHFGLPLSQALEQASVFLDKRGVQSTVSLLASGGMYSASDYLKAIALGCSAVLMGNAALIAMMNQQIKRVTPWLPLTDLLLEGGKKMQKLDIEQASQSLHNFLQATRTEMAIATAAMGKKNLLDLDAGNLIAPSASRPEEAPEAEVWNKSRFLPSFTLRTQK